VLANAKQEELVAAFEFGSNLTNATPTNIYSAEKGFGFEPGAALKEGGTYVTSDKPFSFSVKLPEGNYNITLMLDANDGASTNTVKCEARRLLWEDARSKAGSYVTRTFSINIRTPRIADGSNVKLKSREKEGEVLTWDDKFTLEILGARPCLHSIAITRAPDAATVFITGDSTVCDQPREPWNSWGQMLPRFFGPGIAVANHAQSGESIKSSLGARRFDKVFSEMKTNDWLFVQFGHNDMKDKATNALAVYKTNLKKIVAQTRAKGATPVLVTSMERKRSPVQDTLGDYPQTVRDVAREDGVALIDLHAMSKVLYRALGTNLDKAFQDGTHHNNYGSYEIARCVVEGIRKEVPKLAKFIASDVESFDPAHPDDPDKFQLPASLAVDDKKPDGN
jgi:lysophospholipase L1-like esterase